MRSRERGNELGRVQELVDQMAGIEVDPERRVPADGLQGQRGRRKVVRDLGQVHLEPEADPLRLEDLEDGQPPFGEVLVPRSISAQSLGGNE